MKHLPNLLSATRLVLAPYIFYLLATNQFRPALAWFALAGLTDALDGYIARTFDAGSRVGAYLDPIADKILVSGTFIILALTATIPWWLTGLVLFRDGAILCAAGFFLLTKNRRDFPPSVWGKFSTTAQLLYVFLVLALGAGYGNSALVNSLEWITVVLTVWSGFDYARKSREISVANSGNWSA